MARFSNYQFGTEYDWRGVKLEIGQTVIYGAGSGNHSINVVEGEVIGLANDKGNIKIKVIRREGASYGGARKAVSLKHDRVTVIESMPKPQLPTDEERRIIHEREMAESEARFATHRMAKEPIRPDPTNPIYQTVPPAMPNLDPSPYGYNSRRYTAPQTGYSHPQYQADAQKYNEDRQWWWEHACEKCEYSRNDCYEFACPK